MKFTKAQLENFLKELNDVINLKGDYIESDEFYKLLPSSSLDNPSNPEVIISLIEAVIGLSEALEFFTQNTTRNYSDPNETKAYTKAFEALEKWGVLE